MLLMTDASVYLTRLWHNRTIYACPQCGTTRSTIPSIERHLAITGHTPVPDEAVREALEETAQDVPDDAFQDAPQDATASDPLPDEREV
jgi:hypothetical protein